MVEEAGDVEAFADFTVEDAGGNKDAPKADKKEAHDALKRDVFPWLVGSESVTNEHQRDALLLGLRIMKNVSA